MSWMMLVVLPLIPRAYFVFTFFIALKFFSFFLSFFFKFFKICVPYAFFKVVFLCWRKLSAHFVVPRRQQLSFHAHQLLLLIIAAA